MRQPMRRLRSRPANCVAKRSRVIKCHAFSKVHHCGLCPRRFRQLGASSSKATPKHGTLRAFLTQRALHTWSAHYAPLQCARALRRVVVATKADGFWRTRFGGRVGTNASRFPPSLPFSLIAAVRFLDRSISQDCTASSPILSRHYRASGSLPTGTVALVWISGIRWKIRSKTQPRR